MSYTANLEQFLSSNVNTQISNGLSSKKVEAYSSRSEGESAFEKILKDISLKKNSTEPKKLNNISSDRNSVQNESSASEAKSNNDAVEKTKIQQNENNISDDEKVDSKEKDSVKNLSYVPEEAVEQSAYFAVMGLENNNVNFEASEISIENSIGAIDSSVKINDVDLDKITSMLSESVEVAALEESVTPEFEAILKEVQDISVEKPEQFLEAMESVSLDNETELNSDQIVLNTENFEAGSEEQNNNLFSQQKIVSDPKSKITVIDERTEEEKIDLDFNSSKDIQVEAKQSSENIVEVTYNLNENVNQNILSSNNQTAAANGSNYQQLLSNQVQNNVPDFVKAATVVLKDNNNGLINLNLKPEALGNVKISLQLSDKLITGQITVHSKEAFEAFKANMESLKIALEQSGFENAELNLNFAQSDSSFFENGNGQDSSEQFMAKQTYGDLVVHKETADVAVERYESGKDYRIDVVA